MRPPTTIELLNVWEEGLNQSLLDRALHLLQVACMTPDINRVAALSIGERDARLLLLREWLFGSRLTNKASCPACSEVVEWENSTDDLLLQAPSAASPLPLEHTLVEAGFTIRFRLVNSHDLQRVLQQPLYQTKPEQLLADCVTSLLHGKEPCLFDALPAAVTEALNQRMEQEDPQANIQMLVVCPGCTHQWEVSFDIAGYLWLEVDSWARHLLREVYALARAFGWAENDILRMSPPRRQLYLDLIGA
ncbi:T4 family baseplate hub assembly chaperone [Hymenobacter sp. HD11105]